MLAMSQMGMAMLGLFFGVGVAFAIFFANMAAAKFSRGNALLDIVIRLGCYGVLVVLGAEVIGSLFGSDVRLHVIWFWGAFAAGFAIVPWAVAIYFRAKGP